MAHERPAVPQRDPHGRHPTPDPTGRRRAVGRRPNRCRQLRPEPQGRRTADGRHLRRRRRRVDRRDRLDRQGLHGRHDGPTILHPGPMTEIAELCLTVDLGTGGPKIGLVTLDGDVLDHELHCVETTFTENGGAEQDANEWWTLISDSAKRLLARPDVSASRVKAVAVTGQYASTVPVDANGVATGPYRTWRDTKGGRYSRKAIGGAFQG